MFDSRRPLSRRADAGFTLIEVMITFDNAHPVAGSRRSEHDHKHRLRTVRPYDYQDATQLVFDFWAAVESVMRDEGVWS